MLGFMNEEALAETQRTQREVFFSRSRNKLWRKGESSGHVLEGAGDRVDCDCRLAAGASAARAGRECATKAIEVVSIANWKMDGSAKVTEERAFAPEEVYGRSTQT